MDDLFPGLNPDAQRELQQRRPRAQLPELHPVIWVILVLLLANLGLTLYITDVVYHLVRLVNG